MHSELHTFMFFTCFLKGKTAILRYHLGLSVSVSNSVTDDRYGYKKFDLSIMYLHSLGKEIGKLTYPCYKTTQLQYKTVIMYFHQYPGPLKLNSAADYHHREKTVCYNLNMYILNTYAF